MRKLNNDDVRKALYQISAGQTETDFNLRALSGFLHQMAFGQRSLSWLLPPILFKH
jgi:hypothetical protein